jgi:hypothetical protein
MQGWHPGQSGEVTVEMQRADCLVYYIRACAFGVRNTCMLVACCVYLLCVCASVRVRVCEATRFRIQHYTPINI